MRVAKKVEPPLTCVGRATGGLGRSIEDLARACTSARIPSIDFTALMTRRRRDTRWTDRPALRCTAWPCGTSHGAVPGLGLRPV